jgi:hypothetical protein
VEPEDPVENTTLAAEPAAGTTIPRSLLGGTGGVPLGVEGLAITARLIDDPGSPLYRARERELLAAGLLQALQALDRGYRTAGTSR